MRNSVGDRGLRGPALTPREEKRLKRGGMSLRIILCVPTSSARDSPAVAPGHDCPRDHPAQAPGREEGRFSPR